MSGNGVARRLGLQQSAIRKALERLVARGVVTRTDVGRTAAYALDARREVVRRMVLPAFRAEAQLGERLRRALQRLALALRPRPAAVVLYGSVARGAAAPGDVDLLVVLARAEDEEPVRAALLDGVRPVELRFQLAVHPVVLTAAELARRVDDPLVAAIATDGLLLSGRPPAPLRRVRALPPPPPRRTGTRAAAAASAPARAGGARLRGARGGPRPQRARPRGGRAPVTRTLKTKRVDRAQAGTYRAKARGFRADAKAMGALGAAPRGRVGSARPILRRAAVARHLPRDRRVRAPEPHSDPAVRLAGGEPPRDLLALSRGQRAFGPLCRRAPAAACARRSAGSRAGVSRSAARWRGTTRPSATASRSRPARRPSSRRVPSSPPATSVAPFSYPRGGAPTP